MAKLLYDVTVRFVDKKPMRAELDRDHLFFDKVMDDNGKKVEWIQRFRPVAR